ncbi:hypothetical protein NPIL_93861 [Nephila pilipes]|uniref:Uncharacterized protein n=1 Tax=Nephila pilipes TaxID=299642 RepID=A0A8X6TQX2_NEPPI|nr:hypothetical protein NPIL_93861 [Nephila pilipes]
MEGKITIPAHSLTYKESGFGHICSGATESSPETQHCWLFTHENTVEETLRKFWKMESVLEEPSSKSNNIASAVGLQHQLITILNSGGMESHKCCCYESALLEPVFFNDEEYNLEENISINTASHLADLISRGVNTDEIEGNSLWWREQDFFHQDIAESFTGPKPSSNEDYLQEF